MDTTELNRNNLYNWLMFTRDLLPYGPRRRRMSDWLNWTRKTYKHDMKLINKRVYERFFKDYDSIPLLDPEYML